MCRNNSFDRAISIVFETALRLKQVSPTHFVPTLFFMDNISNSEFCSFPVTHMYTSNPGAFVP